VLYRFGSAFCIICGLQAVPRLRPVSKGGKQRTGVASEQS